MTEESETGSLRKNLKKAGAGLVLAMAIVAGAANIGGAVTWVRELTGSSPTASSAPSKDSVPDGNLKPSGSKPPSTVDSSIPTISGPTRTTPPPPSPQVDTRPILGTWEGTYRCGSLRGLELAIVSDPKNSAGLLATFTFFPTDGNAGSPLGSYVMKGSFKSGKLTLDHDYWIQNKDGYTPVGLRGEIDSSSSPLKLAGTVTDNCKNFELRKTSDAASPPSI